MSAFGSLMVEKEDERRASRVAGAADAVGTGTAGRTSPFIADTTVFGTTMVSNLDLMVKSTGRLLIPGLSLTGAPCLRCDQNGRKQNSSPSINVREQTLRFSSVVVAETRCTRATRRDLTSTPSSFYRSPRTFQVCTLDRE
jgi:hypothetical protein